MEEPDPLARTPDALLGRAMAALLAGALALTLAGAVAIDRAERRADTTAAIAAEAASASARAAGRRDAAAASRRTRILVAAGETAGLVLLAAAIGGRARRRIAAWRDATRAAECEARRELLHDPLTHLPNATWLRAHLARLAAGADRAVRHTAVLRIDLDGFRATRETLGPRVADEILRIAARRLRTVLRAGDFAARLGHDDFVIVADDLEDAAAAACIAHRVQQALAKPFALQGGAQSIRCSIGVALLADDLPEAERVLANADLALAEAQGTPSGVRCFGTSLRQDCERREALFSDLLAALDRGEIMPFFQPQVDLATGRFAGFEALARWRHPRRGLLGPAAFLDFAEAAGLSDRIGEAILGQSLRALRAWDAAGLEVPQVGVNFAMAELRDPRLIEKIKWEAERHDVDPARIAIEVLETVLIKSDEDPMVRNLRGLASAGFRIELDDFGTGHASIQNLRRFSVHRIKIDRSFVDGIEACAEQRTLTASMIAMADALGIATLAEGVETAQAAATLRGLGCGHAQGFVIAHPMALADSFAWLRAHADPDAAKA